MRSHKLRLLISFALLLAILLSISTAALAEGITDDEGREYEAVRVYLDGLLSFRAYYDGEAYFFPFNSLVSFFDIEAFDDYDAETGELRIYGENLELSAGRDRDYLKVNKRWLYNPEGFRFISGRLCFSLQITERIFGLEFPELCENSIFGSSKDAGLISGSNTYYEDTFGVEELLWLTRIINSEAGTEPFNGMIAVGNTVLNRVASEIYPDNIKDVIFDTDICVQFQPTDDLTINKTPSEEARIAACLCFEGYNIVEDCMYFVERFGLVDDSWFKATKKYYTTIGSHDFYV